MSQQMQSDDRRERSIEEQEVYTPRQVNTDTREQSRQDEPVGHAESAGNDEYGGYEPGYGGQRQQQEEKLRPESERPSQYAGPQGQSSQRKRRRWVRPLVIAVILLILLGGMSSGFRYLGFGTTMHTETPQAFTVNQNAVISVQNNVGNITIHRGGSGNQVSVTTTVRDDFLGHDPQVAYNSGDGNTLNIAVEDNRSGLNFVNLSSVNLDITVPDNMNLDLHTSLGDINIEGFQGQITAQSSAGDVTVTDVNLSGSGELQSSAGNVDFSGTFADNANYTLHTSAGNVDANFDPQDNVHIDARTSAGDIDSDLPAVQVRDDGPVNKEAHGDLGNSQNQATVSLETSAGNVDIGEQ